MVKVGAFEIRQAVADDLDRIVELDRLFGSAALTRDYFEAWLHHHPEGFLVASYNGRLCAYSMVINLPHGQIRENWLLDTGGGTCATHTPLGDTLYAVSIASQKQEAARALFIMNRRLFARSHLAQAVIYGRLPRFRQWVQQMGYDPCQISYDQKKQLLGIYVNTLHDPYQVFYEGMNLTPEYGVVDYLEGDEESLNCALKLVWRNPCYRPLPLDHAVVQVEVATSPPRSSLSTRQ
ncbi:hypothetical protein HRbin15_00173 [bacterium HR15]|nr:hypothetical protein HRbin15_00173 [bacterium HR15]